AAPEPAAVLALLGEVRGPQSAQQILRAVVGSGVPAPDPARRPDRLDPSALGLWAVWQLASERPQAAGSAFGELLDRGSERPRTLLDAARLFETLDPRTKAATAAAMPTLAEGQRRRAAVELGILAGWAPPATHEPALEAALAAEGEAGVSPELLAALVGGPMDVRARGLLLQRLEAMIDDPALHDSSVPRAVEAAVVALRRLERDYEGDLLTGSALGLARRNPQAPASLAIRAPGWPRRPGPPPRALVRLALQLPFNLPVAPPSEER
ncbi:MAG: hypothetical protein AAFZ65_10740, partial [Planctomycetota bacterium]